MKKFVLRAVFLILLLGISMFFEKIFLRKSAHTEIIREFFNGKEEYDILAFGPSYMYCTFSPPVLFSNFGLRSFVCASPCQPVNETYYFIKQALQKYHPKIVILCANMIAFSEEQYIHSAAFAHEATDGFPVGLAKLGMILNLHSDCRSIDEFFCPFLKYHTRWKTLSKIDFDGKFIRNDFNGYRLQWNPKKRFVNNLVPYDLKTIEHEKIFPENLEWLNRIKSLVDDAGASLVLLSAPRHTNRAFYRRLASLHDYADVKGIDFLDLNLDFVKTGLSNKTDFYDDGHLNVLGAEKATLYIGHWLRKHFNFDAHISSENQAQWEDEVKRYDKVKRKVTASSSAGVGK